MEYFHFVPNPDMDVNMIKKDSEIYPIEFKLHENFKTLYGEDNICFSKANFRSILPMDDEGKTLLEQLTDIEKKEMFIIYPQILSHGYDRFNIIYSKIKEGEYGNLNLECVLSRMQCMLRLSPKQIYVSEKKVEIWIPNIGNNIETITHLMQICSYKRINDKDSEKFKGFMVKCVFEKK